MQADVILVDDYCYHLASITIQHGDRDWAFINVKAVMDAAYQVIRIPCSKIAVQAGR